MKKWDKVPASFPLQHDTAQETLPPPSLSHITNFQMRITFLTQSSTKPSTLKPACGNNICTLGENVSGITFSQQEQKFWSCLCVLGLKHSHVPCCGIPADKGLMCMFQTPIGCGASQGLSVVTERTAGNNQGSSILTHRGKDKMRLEKGFMRRQGSTFPCPSSSG